MARIFNKQKAETLSSSDSCSEVYESLSEPENSFCKTGVPKREIRFFRADAAGNVTLLVTSHVEEADYAAVARYLLAINELDGDEIAGEQVAFVVDEDTMCMCGHEFCGNASRSFALMKARGLITPESAKSGSAQKSYGSAGDDRACKKRGISDKITISTSGAERPLDVIVDAKTGFTKIRMPDIIRINRPEELNISGNITGMNGITHLVEMDGILHVITSGIEPVRENFNAIKEAVFSSFSGSSGKDLPAVGVMFTGETVSEDPAADTNKDVIPIRMTPVVYVTEVDTTYFEGSCGSGTTALCAALSEGRSDGTYIYDIRQPKGTIRCSCTVRNGSIKDIFIEGPVSISREYIVLL